MPKGRSSARESCSPSSSGPDGAFSLKTSAHSQHTTPKRSLVEVAPNPLSARIRDGRAKTDRPGKRACPSHELVRRRRIRPQPRKGHTMMPMTSTDNGVTTTNFAWSHEQVDGTSTAEIVDAARGAE